MHVVIWEYRVAPESQTDFERAYGPEGDWVRLFREARGFLGTELLRDGEDPSRYTTIDRWSSADEYDAFRRDHAAAYNALDAVCDRLTSDERFVGSYEPV